MNLYEKRVGIKIGSEIKQAGYRWHISGIILHPRRANKVTPHWYAIFNLQTHYFPPNMILDYERNGFATMIILKRKVTYLCNGENALYAKSVTGTFGKV